MDLLTTCTYDSELQAITAPPPTSTIHKSPQHPLSLSQRAMSSPAVPWQRLLTVEILQLHSTELSTNKKLCSFLITFRHGPHRKHSSSIVASSCCIIKNLLPSKGNLFTEPLPRNGRRSHCLTTGQYAAICLSALVI
jgi:hypothetical protein